VVDVTRFEEAVAGSAPNGLIVLLPNEFATRHHPDARSGVSDVSNLIVVEKPALRTSRRAGARQVTAFGRA
jgi:hypothetical protein